MRQRQRRLARGRFITLLLATLVACGGLLPATAVAGARLNDLPPIGCSGIVPYSLATISASTDGASLVWNTESYDTPSDKYSYAIWAARLSDRAPLRIANGDAYVSDPDISGDLVAWTRHPEYASGGEYDGDIAAHNLATGDDIVVAATASDEESPAVEGSWIAWLSVDDNVMELKALDTAAAGEPLTLGVADNVGDYQLLSAPVAAHGNLYWSVKQTGEARWDVYRADLAEGASVTRVLADVPQYPLVDGGVAVLGTSGSLETGLQRFHVVDLDTLAEHDATLRVPYGPGLLASDGRYLLAAYTTRFGGSTGTDEQFVLYDLATGSSWDGPWGTNPRARIEGGVLAWSAGASTLGAVCVGAAPVTDFAPSAPVPDPAQPDVRWAPQTGHTLRGAFAGYWDANGGLPDFGYALTEEFQEHNADSGVDLSAQYFERQRFEYHSELVGTPYEVELGRLGAELLVAQGRDWTTFPLADLTKPHVVPETGHAIAPEFWEYWSSHGLELGDAGVSWRESVALFGYPLSEPMTETNADGDTVLTQYYERAVFEYHPENAGTPYVVLLRRLGAEALAARGW
jgi:hypothetical protein